MKIKISAELGQDVYRRLRLAASCENRAVDEVIESAVANYLQHTAISAKSSGIARLLQSDPLEVGTREFRLAMEADYWDQ